MQRYSKEFREEAISLSDEIGPKKAAQQLGINYATLIDWRKKRKTKERKINRRTKNCRGTAERNCRIEKSQ